MTIKQMCMHKQMALKLKEFHHGTVPNCACWGKKLCTTPLQLTLQ